MKIYMKAAVKTTSRHLKTRPLPPQVTARSPLADIHSAFWVSVNTASLVTDSILPHDCFHLHFVFGCVFDSFFCSLKLQVKKTLHLEFYILQLWHNRVSLVCLFADDATRYVEKPLINTVKVKQLFKVHFLEEVTPWACTLRSDESSHHCHVAANLICWRGVNANEAW